MNPYILLAWIASLAGGAGLGWIARGDHDAAQKLEQQVAVTQSTAQAQATVDTLAAGQATAQARQAVRDRIITKEVIRYVEVTPAADRCTLPGSWRVRHDAAATGTPAEPAELAAGAAAPVEDAAALETVADNYGACRHAIDQVSGWQSWWDTVKGAPRGQPE